ncbi:HipA family kinase [uncultured Sphingomonas sp.]|uniref:HipA family kinase n=1 Tax=uncultured Sphingomonas sp. TaxID=158754 RepID=UPI0025D1F333|nr:HipA family kinase [uncultured Sphingomonas sp.]
MVLLLDMFDIVEIVRPIESGMTRPFLCRLADGHLYAVKGRAALHHGLIAEFVAGCLGRQLGLPIPPFIVAHMPRALLHHYPDHDAMSAIGLGPVFASAWQESIQPFTPLTLSIQDPTLMARLYVFDHWIANGDRSLTEHGGNPNIFIRLNGGTPVVIDHNLAFSQDYDAAQELPLHVGRNAWTVWGNRPNFQSEMLDTMDRVCASWRDIVDHIPDEWLDGQEDFLDRIAATLERRHTPGFWTELG